MKKIISILSISFLMLPLLASAATPSCWTCSGFYSEWCGDGACQYECGETTSQSSACYCNGDCKQCGNICSNNSQCVSSCPYCTNGRCSQTTVASNTGGNDYGNDCPTGQICNPLKYNSFEQLLSGISNFVFKIAMVLAPLMLVIAGLLWVTSAGDPKRVETAKNMALYTIIGLAVILLASGLVAVLKSIIGYTG
jgi:hypothetical protein